MSESSVLSRVMDQASEAAANFSPPTVQSQGQGQQLVGQQVGMSRPSLQSMRDSAGISVDLYLTVKDTGFRLGDSKAKLFQTAKGRVDMGKVMPIYQVRCTRGGSTTFLKSYDGVSTSQGENFAQAISNARATYDKVDGPYQTAEVPFVLEEDAGGQKAGTRIGITPPITGVKFLNDFLTTVANNGLDGEELEVQITHKPQSNKNGNEWGVVEWKLLGKADAQA